MVVRLINNEVAGSYGDVIGSMFPVTEDFFSGSGSTVKTFDKNMDGFSLFNDGSAAMSFQIGAITVTLKADESWVSYFKPFDQVTITAPAGNAWRAEVVSVANTPPSTSDVSVQSAPPLNITSLKASNVLGTSVMLSWGASASANVTGYAIYKGSELIDTINGTIYEATNLATGTTYIFTVRAKNVDGTLSSGLSVSVTTSGQIDTTPPSNVQNLSAIGITQTTVTLTWNAPTSGDAVNYEVLQDGVVLDTVTETTFNVTGLAAGTTYSFMVKAKDASGNKASGATIPVTTSEASGDVTAPSPVTNLGHGTPTASTIPLTWTDSVSSDVTHFEVAYSTDGTSFTVANGNVAASATSYTITGLAGSTTYTVRVVAIDGAGNRSTAAADTATTAASSDVTAPNPVASLTAGTPTATTVPLTWTASGSSDIASHEVAYSTDGTNFTVAADDVAAGATGYTVTGLSAETSYTFRVVVVDTSGNRSTAATATATTQAEAAPTVSITDSFTRADSTTSLGTTDTGETWNALAGTWGILSNQAYQPSYEGIVGLATIDAGVADGTVQVTFPTNKQLAFLIFRVVDANNYLFVQSNNTLYALYKYVDGTATKITDTILEGVGHGQVDGDTIQVVLAGSSIVVNLNGSQIFSETITEFQTATKHGIGQSFSAESRFDNFSITSSATPADTTAPTVSVVPAGGSYTSAQSVTLTASDETATTIYYTTDGSAPTEASTVYSSPIPVSATTTLKYFAKDTAGNSSTVQTAVYTISQPYALSMNGNGDYIQAPSMTFDEIQMDFTVNPVADTFAYYFDARIGASAYLARTTANVEDHTGCICYVDGKQKGTGVETSVTNNKRTTVKAYFSTAVTDDVTIFSKNDATDSMLGKLHRVSFFLAGASVAVYDFSAQFAGTTVPDSSGNGNAATLTGGTWVQETLENHSTATDYHIVLNGTDNKLALPIPANTKYIDLTLSREANDVDGYVFDLRNAQTTPVNNAYCASVGVAGYTAVTVDGTGKTVAAANATTDLPNATVVPIRFTLTSTTKSGVINIGGNGPLTTSAGDWHTLNIHAVKFLDASLNLLEEYDITTGTGATIYGKLLGMNGSILGTVDAGTWVANP